MRNNFHVAAEKGDIAVLNSLNNPKDLLEKDIDGNTPLFIAAMGASLNKNTHLGNKCVHWIKTLLKNNQITDESFKMENNNGDYLLHSLIELDDKELLESVIQKYDRIYGNRNYLYHKDNNKNCPWDLKSDQATMALLKLDDEKFKYEDGSPLHEVYKKSEELAKKKLIKPYMLLRRNKDEYTPLDLAAKLQPYDENLLLSLLEADYKSVLKTAKIRKSDTWLHTLIIYQPNELAKIQSLVNRSKYSVKNSVQSKNSSGNTPLHTAVLTDNTKLIDFLLSIGANLSSLNDDNLTPLEYAAAEQRFEMYEHLYELQKHKDLTPVEIKWLKFLSMHQLYFIFGGKKLVDAIGNIPEFYEGGYTEHILPILRNTLTNFSGLQNKYDQKKVNAIVNQLEKFKFDYQLPNHLMPSTLDDYVKRILAGEPLITDTGYASHILGVSIQKKGKEIELTYLERGYWTQYADDRIHCHAAYTLKIPNDADKLKQILPLLHEAKNKKNDNDAKEILFTKIPDIAGSKFKNENALGIDLATKPFKVGICYWANFKAVVHDLFIKKFGIRNGQKLYKDYDLYLHQQALQDYLHCVPKTEQNDKLIQLCEKIIHDKHLKYVNDQFTKLHDPVKPQPVHEKVNNALALRP